MKKCPNKKVIVIGVATYLVMWLVIAPIAIGMFGFINSYRIVKRDTVNTYIDTLNSLKVDTRNPDVYCESPSNPSYNYYSDEPYNYEYSRKAVSVKEFDKFESDLSKFMDCMRNKYHHDNLESLTKINKI